MDRNKKDMLKKMYQTNKKDLYNYKITNKTFLELARDNNLDVDKLIESYFEYDDIILAQLEEEQKKMIGEKVLDTLTMNGNISPVEIYDHIAAVSSKLLDFKFNKTMLINNINKCDDDMYMILSPMDIVMLTINIDSKNKEIYNDEDMELLEQFFNLAEQSPVITGKTAKKILKFIDSKRLSVRENTKLYNRFIYAHEKKLYLDYLLQSDKDKQFDMSLSDYYKDNKIICDYLYNDEKEDNNVKKKIK